LLRRQFSRDTLVMGVLLINNIAFEIGYVIGRRSGFSHSLF